MSLPRGARGQGRCGRQDGSVLLLVLFACLSVAVAIQTLSVVVVCAERALLDESAGRARAKDKDEGLGILRHQALEDWQPMSWSVISGGPNAVEGCVSELANGLGWIMRVDVRQQPTVSRILTSAWLERGRDGLDLPLAAMVAGDVVGDSDRESPWIEIEGQDSPAVGDAQPAVRTAVGYLADLPQGALLGEGCSLAKLSYPWQLDAGWRLLGSDTSNGVETGRATAPGNESTAGDVRAVAPGPGVTVMAARPGETVRLPSECGGPSADSPLLVVVTGGADLDARDRGDLYGVIVVDEGGLLLEGTVLHGAVFAGETVALGKRGCVVYSQAVLRWATDRSLERVRLVPGTRWEGTE